MRRAAFTVDVDRDVNQPEVGRREAVCRPCEGSSTPRFASSARGLEMLVGLLDELGVRGTFFLEAETAQRIAERADLRGLLAGHEVASHGWSHEDLTGASTQVTMGEEEVGGIIDRAGAAIEELTGRPPRGFRAPYQHIGPTALRLLAGRGYWYDSSVTRNILSRRLLPYRQPEGLTEFPLARGTDERGRPIHSYLWPMHEGKRRPADYLRLLDQYDEGVMVLATHSWHVVETYRGVLDPLEARAQLEQVRAVVEGALDRGIGFNTLEGHLRRGLDDEQEGMVPGT